MRLLDSIGGVAVLVQGSIPLLHLSDANAVLAALTVGGVAIFCSRMAGKTNADPALAELRQSVRLLEGENEILRDELRQVRPRERVESFRNRRDTPLSGIPAEDDPTA